jgi:alkylhydroperoxidase/carboxymuconolactone decarboxylase family protein YurZ
VNDHGARLLEKIRSERGYVLPTHEYLADHHPQFLEVYDEFFSAAMSEQSPLSRKVREFVLMAADIALGASPDAVGGHVKRAIEHGATEEECLAVVELTTLAFAAKSLGIGIPSMKHASPS